MKRNSGSEFIFQLFALMLSVIVVHAAYVTVIRPNADAILNQQLEKQAQGEAFVQQRSIYVVLKDYEQETCFVLMFWALMIMGYKARIALEERNMLSRQLLKLSSGSSILPQDSREYSRTIQDLPSHEQKLMAPRTLLMALQRFGATANVAAVATAIKDVCDAESDRLDSELAMVRYIAWAIPSIGFIGTVRGIGEALGQAHKAVEGDIVGVTISLGVAFNSTFIALVISIFIMFFSHQLQLLQERLVQNTQDYCDTNLLTHLKVEPAEGLAR
ncbi:MAG: biopolymer transport protein ExbB/TolQ [Alteromonadaceae bacterium]|jgi:biopolymer transport protein ExbB/TolQ